MQFYDTTHISTFFSFNLTWLVIIIYCYFELWRSIIRKYILNWLFKNWMRDMCVATLSNNIGDRADRRASHWPEKSFRHLPKWIAIGVNFPKEHIPYKSNARMFDRIIFTLAGCIMRLYASAWPCALSPK